MEREREEGREGGGQVKGKTQFPALRNALRQRGQKKFRAAGGQSQIKVLALLSSKVEHLPTLSPPNIS